MYTLKQKKKAVNLYYRYDKHLSLVIAKLGYPSINSLRNWIEEYKNTGKIHMNYSREAKFSKDEIKKAISYYKKHGRSITGTIKALGYPCRFTLQKWLLEYEPSYKPRIKKSSINNTSEEIKISASIELCTSERNAKDIALDYNVTRVALYQWKKKIKGKGNEHSMVKKKNRDNKISNKSQELNEEIIRLKNEVNTLLKDVEKLRLEKDILEKAAELIKKDKGINVDDLSNREKTIIIDALRDKYKLYCLLKALSIAKSTYFYEHIIINSQDKYKDLRVIIKEIFDNSFKRYGYRRIHHELKKRDIVLSEKVIRRIMKEDNLVVYIPKIKKYSSYEGEITPAVENLIRRDFHSDEPYEKILTDLTEFHIPAGKIYLSPMIDCFDGLPLVWTIGTSPNAELVNTMLDSAINIIPENKHPIVHSDRGAHYRWSGWIERMNNAGYTRSMSKKGCSPDNSACEGFFGRLKNEFFYCNDWSNVSIECFINQLDEYIKWYGKTRIKVSLGGLSPIEYRQSLGLL